MDIIIIGAGLAGLTAAIALAKAGHRVKVIERKDRIWTVGGAINLTTGATSILNTLGLQEKISAISDHTDTVNQRDLLTGTIFRVIPMAKTPESASRTIMRPSLMHLLFEEASRLKVDFSFSSTVVDLAETTSGTSATLENGSILRADLLIAADGVRSRMRGKVLASVVSDPIQLQPWHSNRTYYVMKLKPEDLKSLISCEELLAPHCLNFWAGRDERYALSLYNPGPNHLSAVYCLREPIAMTTLHDEAGDVKHVREKFAGRCHPELEKVLSVAKECERWQLSQMPDLPTWRSPGGRTILLGDAAHAMHPTAGQGYSSTVEEIAVLAHLLETPSADLPKSTRLWERFCRPRSNRLKAYANFLSRQYEGDEEALMQAKVQRERDAEMQKRDPEMEGVVGDMYAEFGGPEFRIWIARHDALKEAKEYIEKMAPESLAAE